MERCQTETGSAFDATSLSLRALSQAGRLCDTRINLSDALPAGAQKQKASPESGADVESVVSRPTGSDDIDSDATTVCDSQE